MEILEGLVGSLLKFETSPMRFEALCIDLLSAQENATFVPTSRTWDMGRDGRRALQDDGGTHVVCVSLSETIDKKVEADIRRLEATTKPRSIVYCTSRDISEHAADDLSAEIRRLSSSVESVNVLYQSQIASMALRRQDILHKHYRAEITNLQSLFFGDAAQAHDPENTGLRLALLTQTGDSAVELREALARRLVLEQLKVAGPQTLNGLLVKLSQQLHLPRTISLTYGQGVATTLHSCGHVARTGAKLEITAAGEDWLADVPAEASTRLLEGRKLIRQALEELTGYGLPDTDFERVWNTFQDGIAELFFQHGSAIVQMVAAVQEGRRVDGDERVRAIRERLADQIKALFTGPERRDEMRQAVIDLFSEKGSPAFEWLAEVCTVYVMMCSLGLEPKSSAAVTDALREVALLLDTDVLLSLLSVGERNHEETERVIGGWRALGGQVVAPDPALEEAAYHAWIAPGDYKAVAGQLAGLSDTQADRVIGNAFVRGFWAASKGRFERKWWERYIEQYRGRHKYDYSKIVDLLRDEYRIDRLSGFGTDSGNSGDSFYVDVFKFMTQQLASEAGCDIEGLDYRVVDKARRDALTIAALRSARASFRSQGRSGTLMAVSSARLIKEADMRFRADLGEPDAILSLAAVATLLAVTPGVHFGLGSLRGVLFDINLAKRLSPIQRYAYRMISQSEEYDIPWSRRVSLKRKLGERLLRDARASDKPIDEIARLVTSSDEPEYSAEVIKDALDGMAVTPQSEKELASLRREVERLREELASRPDRN